MSPFLDSTVDRPLFLYFRPFNAVNRKYKLLMIGFELLSCGDKMGSLLQSFA